MPPVLCVPSPARTGTLTHLAMVPPSTKRLPRTDCWLECHEGFRHRYTDLDTSSPRRSLGSGTVAALLIASVVGVGLLFAASDRPQQLQQQQQLNTAAVPEIGPLSVSRSSSSSTSDTAYAAGISLWNLDYNDSAFTLDRLYPWLFVAEPHRRAVLMIDVQHADGLEASVR